MRLQKVKISDDRYSKITMRKKYKTMQKKITSRHDICIHIPIHTNDQLIIHTVKTKQLQTLAKQIN